MTQQDQHANMLAKQVYAKWASCTKLGSNAGLTGTFALWRWSVPRQTNKKAKSDSACCALNVKFGPIRGCETLFYPAHPLGGVIGEIKTSTENYISHWDSVRNDCGLAGRGAI